MLFFNGSCPCLLQLGDVNAEAHPVAVWRQPFHDAQHAAAGKLLHQVKLRKSVLCHALGHPLVNPAHGSRVFATLGTIPNDVFKRTARCHQGGSQRIQLPVAVVAIDQPVNVVIEHKAFAQCVDGATQCALLLCRLLAGANQLGHIGSGAGHGQRAPVRRAHRDTATVLHPNHVAVFVHGTEGVIVVGQLALPVPPQHGLTGGVIVGIGGEREQFNGVVAEFARRITQQLGPAVVVVDMVSPQVPFDRARTGPFDQALHAVFGRLRLQLSLLERSDVNVGAIHQQGFAVRRERHHAPGVAYPHRVAVSVLHAKYRFIARRHTGKVPLQRRLGLRQIVRVAEARPGFNGGGLQLIQRVAQHLGPDGVEHRLTRLHVPFPGGGSGAVNGALQLVPPTFQLQLAQLAVMHVLERAVHPNATPVHHLGRANAAHPDRVADMVDQLLLQIPTGAAFDGTTHGAASLFPGGTFREEQQRRLARDHEISRHLEQAAGDVGPGHDVALDIQVPGADVCRLVGQLQVPLGFLQCLLCHFTRRDVGADGDKPLNDTVLVKEWGNQ